MRWGDIAYEARLQHLRFTPHTSATGAGAFRLNAAVRRLQVAFPALGEGEVLAVCMVHARCSTVVRISLGQRNGRHPSSTP